MDHKLTFPQELIKATGEAVGSVYALPELSDNDAAIYGIDGIVSTIYLKGDIVGKISLFIRTTSAAKIVAKMLCVEDIADDSPEVLDGVGEILNILTGCFELRLEQHKLNMQISVPSTRETSILPIGRWENNIEQLYKANDVYFRVSLSYRLAAKEDKPIDVVIPAQAKLKLSAADLLKQILAKKPQSL